MATMLGTFSSANIRTACTDETGNGSLVFATNPDFTGPTARGQPIALSRLTQYEAFTVGGTNVATSFMDANYVGSKIYGANTLQTGTVIRVTTWGQLNSFSGGGTLNISLFVNGASYLNLAVPSTAAGYIKTDFDLYIRVTQARARGILMQSGQNAVLGDSGGFVFDKTIANSIDAYFNFSVASGSNIFSPLGVTISTHFQQ